ncbi:MAG TPA: GNAT family N-acetyltransferase [Thermoanaerobaculia bacterium]|nr:GNAT family N-acetyltransferase [Thermoanaerobaculia bacterium]
MAADAAALAAFGARTFEDTFGAANRPEDVAAFLARTYGEEIQRREIEDPAIVTLLAESSGRFAAFAQLRCGQDTVEIARFYVDRPWQGGGVAQALMREVIEASAALGAKSIWLGVWERNDRAIAFYAKCGFRDAGSQPFLLGSDLQTDRVMVRSSS